MSTKRERLGLSALLLATAVLYLANITVNGMANSFYSGATWAGTKSWKALLFGSVDPGNFITVDKPPLSQWIMGLSGRIFGFNAASLLIPEAIMGVLSVWLTYATVRRIAAAPSAFIAATALAVTPVAALMFRFDNPDAVMLLLMMAATYCTVRAAQNGSRWWLCLAGCALGFAFLAKMLEGVMCLPALVIIYLLAAPRMWMRKGVDILLAALTFVVSAGWYVLLTILWPANERPYLAGSSNNSFLNLVFGYNGLDRVQGHSGRTGRASGSAIARGQVTGDGGATRWPGLRGRGLGGGAMNTKAGITRLFNGEFGLEISWLIPAALISLVGLVILRRGRGSQDAIRALALGAGLWLISDGLVLSFMGGTTHAYYTLAIAPPIAILFGLAIGEGWTARETTKGRLVMALTLMAAADWAVILWFLCDSRWLLPIPVLVAVVGNIAAVILVIPAHVRVMPVALVACLACPAAFAINADAHAHTGSSPSVNPQTAMTQRGGMAGRSTSRANGGSHSGQVDAAVVAKLRSSNARWAAATSTTESASVLELASHTSVMGIGGFSGSDPVPTLAQFQSLVKQHEIGYYVVTQDAGMMTRRALDTFPDRGNDSGGSMRAGARGGTASAITAWVKERYTATEMGSDTVYDLSQVK